MNKRKAKIYVAIKLASKDKALAEAKASMSRDNFIDLVMRQTSSAYPKALLQHCKKMICKKYGLPVRPHLFKNPSIEQFINGIFGDYSVEDIISFFRYETGLGNKGFVHMTIGGQTIMRPALIAMVEHLEAVTGKQLTMVDSDAPLAYLGDDVTFGEIAKYFADTSDVISRLRRRYCSRSDSGIEDALIRFRPTVIDSYRNSAEVPETVTDEELLKSKLKSWVPGDFPKSDWDLPIAWLEDDLNIRLPVESYWVTDETTVGDLINKVMALKRKQLAKRRL